MGIFLRKTALPWGVMFEKQFEWRVGGQGVAFPQNLHDGSFPCFLLLLLLVVAAGGAGGWKWWEEAWRWLVVLAVTSTKPQEVLLWYQFWYFCWTQRVDISLIQHSSNPLLSAPIQSFFLDQPELPIVLLTRRLKKFVAGVLRKDGEHDDSLCLFSNSWLWPHHSILGSK